MISIRPRVASWKKLPIVTGFLKIGKPWRSAFSKRPKTARKLAHDEQNTTRNAGISGGGGLACGAVGLACGASNPNPPNGLGGRRGEWARAWQTSWVGNGWACGLSEWTTSYRLLVIQPEQTSALVPPSSLISPAHSLEEQAASSTVAIDGSANCLCGCIEFMLRGGWRR